MYSDWLKLVAWLTKSDALFQIWEGTLFWNSFMRLSRKVNVDRSTCKSLAACESDLNNVRTSSNRFRLSAESESIVNESKICLCKVLWLRYNVASHSSSFKTFFNLMTLDMIMLESKSRRKNVTDSFVAIRCDKRWNRASAFSPFVVFSHLRWNKIPFESSQQISSRTFLMRKKEVDTFNLQLNKLLKIVRPRYDFVCEWFPLISRNIKYSGSVAVKNSQYSVKV